MVAVAFSLLGGAGWQFFDNSGNVLSGGRLYTYEAGGSTPAATYADSSGNVSNGVYVELDSAGRPSAEIWLLSGQDYKFVVKKYVSSGVYSDIRTYDNIPGAATTADIDALRQELLAYEALIASDDGSDEVGFIQAGFNPVGRTAQSKMREIFSVKDFGAVADDTTDDYDAFNNAILSLIAAGGGTLYVPSGTYRIKSQLAFTIADDESIVIAGDGLGDTVLDFSTASTLGLQFTSSSTTANQRPFFEVSNLSIVTSHDNCGNAIRISYADANNFLPSVLIDKVYIGGNIKRVSDSGSGFGYWTRGAYLTNARNSRVKTTQIVGEINKSPNTGHLIYMTGECTASQVDNCLLMEATTGVEAAGTTEGVSIINTDTLYCRYGLYHNITSGNEPQFTVIGGSVNAANVGIWLNNSIGSVVEGVLIFAASELDSSPWPAFTGVLIEGAESRFITIEGCSITKNASRTGDTCIGIDFNEGRQCTASNNHFFGFSGNELTDGIVVRSGFDQANIQGNNQYEYCTTNESIDPAATKTFGTQLVQSGTTGAIATSTAVLFPQVFPNACTSVSVIHDGTNTAINVTASGVNTTGFTLNHNGGGTAAFKWIAVGR